MNDIQPQLQDMQITSNGQFEREQMARQEFGTWIRRGCYVCCLYFWDFLKPGDREPMVCGPCRERKEAENA